ncbi:MAG TPA: phosphatidylglycerophosphatase A [Candidatus Acidoferrales bacterium]|nr:phosphatidylglycerophosphatase A [Candidatus Acidoferrales bacterium]
MRKFATALAMLGPTGLVPGPHATYGSFVIALIGFFLPVPPLWLFGVLLAIGTAVAVWAAGEAEHVLGHDANAISIDEAIGQSIALLWVPHSWIAFGAAFVLFRVVDVWKPLGAREVQKLPGGWGVVADDVIAGIVACAAFHALRFGLARLGHPLLG